MKFYKRDPEKALAGMMVLTLEERGAYNTLLDLIYHTFDNLPDDDRFVCGWLKCDLRVWKRIKTRLLDLGKIAITDGRITNEAATSAVLSAVDKAGSMSELGRRSAAKRAAQIKQYNDLISTRRSTSRSTIQESQKERNITPLPHSEAPRETSELNKNDSNVVSGSADASRSETEGRYLYEEFPTILTAEEFADNLPRDYKAKLAIFVRKSDESLPGIDWHRIFAINFWDEWVGNKIGEKDDKPFAKKKNWLGSFAWAAENQSRKSRNLPPKQSPKGFQSKLKKLGDA